MRVLYISTLYPPCIGGAQIQLHCLAKAMQEAGHAVHAVTLSGRKRQDWLRLSTVLPEPEEHYAFEGVEVTQLGFPLLDRVRMAPWALTYYGLMAPSVRRLSAITEERLEKAVRDEPSLVHVTRIGREFIAQAGLSYARKRGIPYVLTPNHHPRWKGYLYREYDRLYREADAVVVYTEVEKETLVNEKGVPAERVHVTGVGPVLSDTFDAEAFRRCHDLEGRFVLFLGQQYKYKGIEAIVKAAPLVWEKHADVQFVFIGPHTDDTAGVFEGVRDKRIVNLGIVDMEAKTSALAACTLLCLPSTQESFGGVYAEAWCHRKPVIGGRIPPIQAVVDNGRDGILTSQDPRELAGAMDRLLSDPEACRAMGEAGWRKVQERFTWQLLASKTLAVYEELCACTVDTRQEQL